MSRSRCEVKLQELMRKVRELKPGGDLEGLLEDEIEELRKMVYEEAVAERESPASDSGAFPP